MNPIGIFTKTFPRPTLPETLDAVRAHGLRFVQFSFSSAGLEPLPDVLDSTLLTQIRASHDQRGISIAAVSGTFNMAHPDAAVRKEKLKRFAEVVRGAAALAAPVVTLCTGTRDTTDMWRAHPENGSAAAWRDMRETIDAALEIAAPAHVTLAIEPEVGNVIHTAELARKLLDEVRSPWLQVVMDGANLFHRGDLARQHAVLDTAFDLLGPSIALAHAKDIRHDGQAGDVPAGKGLLDYPYYWALLRQAGYLGPLVLHSLTEQDVDTAIAFLRRVRAG